MIEKVGRLNGALAQPGLGTFMMMMPQVSSSDEFCVFCYCRAWEDQVVYATQQKYVNHQKKTNRSVLLCGPT